MGRQVNFFMLPEDLAELEAAFKAREDVVFLAIRMSGPTPHEEQTLGPLPGDFGGRYLARPADLGKLRIDAIPEQGDYAIRASFSPVVEFSRSKLSEDGGRLSPGRMYVGTSAWDGTRKIPATDEFLKWAGQLFGEIRRSKKYFALKEPDYKGFYISDRVIAWRDKGGVLGW